MNYKDFLTSASYPYLATNEGCALAFDFSYSLEKDSLEETKAAKTRSPKPYMIDLNDDRLVQVRLVITRSSRGVFSNRVISETRFRISPSGSLCMFGVVQVLHKVLSGNLAPPPPRNAYTRTVYLCNAN